MPEGKEETPTPEEIKQEEQEEEEILATPEEAKIREKLVEDLGLDPDVDADLIDRLAKKELEDRKRFGKVVGQKRKWRGLAQKKPEVETKKDQPIKGEEKYITKEDLDERDFKGELNSLDVSDELRKQVESYARLSKCSPKEALKSSYITFLKGEEDKKAEEVEAGAGGIRRTHTGKDISKVKKEEMKASDFDFSTKEGRDAYEQWKKDQGIPEPKTL